jgi:hypothetical protein
LFAIQTTGPPNPSRTTFGPTAGSVPPPVGANLVRDSNYRATPPNRRQACSHHGRAKAQLIESGRRNPSIEGFQFRDGPGLGDDGAGQVRLGAGLE